jgi:cobaltochelatase CobS
MTSTKLTGAQERTLLKRALSNLDEATAKTLYESFQPLLPQEKTWRKVIDKARMDVIRDMAAAAGIRASDLATTDNEQPNINTKENAPMTETNIAINEEFAKAIDPMLALATGGKLKSIGQIVSSLESLSGGNEKLIEENKRLSAELAKVMSEISSKPAFTSMEIKSTTDSAIPEGKMELVNAADIFTGPGGKKSSALNFEVPYFAWDGDHPLVPEIDNNYQFQIEHLMACLYSLLKNKNTWIHGHTGTGKTTLVEQIAARLKWPVLRVNMDNDIERSDFLGSTQLVSDGKGGTESKFVEGVLPRAMQMPCIFLVDECDFMKPGVSYVMQRALESKGLLLTEDNGRLIVPHPMFRIMATANTRGQGDEFGCYPGARVMSNAFLDRFTSWMHVDYLDPKQEKLMLSGAFPSVASHIIDQLTVFAKEIRTAFLNRELLMTISPRSLQSICESYTFYKGMLSDEGALKLAVDTVFVERATEDTKAKVVEIANRCFKPVAATAAAAKP